MFHKVSDSACVFGFIISSIFLGLFVWKIWFIESDTTTITMYLQKHTVYLSYLLFLFACSVFSFNLIYTNSDASTPQYYIFLVLFIICLSSFKLTLTTLIIFKLFHGFQNVTSLSLSKPALKWFISLIIIQSVLETLYDLDISLNFMTKWNVNSENHLYKHIVPSIFLTIDVLVAVCVMFLFINKMNRFVRYEYMPTERDKITKISLLCIIAMILRIISSIILITDALIYSKIEDNIMFIARSWITIICLLSQLLCVYLLFPFAERSYACLCSPCEKCFCCQPPQPQSMDYYQRL
eukprot:1130560_1